MLLASCSTGPRRQPAIGEAWAGPATLQLHADIDSRSPVTGVVHHADKLDILRQRRRWYRVRTASGAEGWTSDLSLLDAAQMKRLGALASETAGLPPQGVATTFGTLNVHIEPNRQATSFLQVKEHEKVYLIAHRVEDRAPLPKRELVPPRPKPQRKRKDKMDGVVLPPNPPPPAPPPDWAEISEARDPLPPEQKAPLPKDDWMLIRTATGQSGWVLTSGLYLGIPDEVAQYAEGRRITSYFSLGKIADGDQRKDIWLWTTADRLGEPQDFDGYRVFVWSLRHHRYETSYIQRRIRGFFPVIAKPGEFSVCVAQDDGSLVRKHYVMAGNLVHLEDQQPCQKFSVTDAPAQQIVTKAAPAGSRGPMPGTGGMFADFKSRVKRLLGRS